MNVNDQLHHWLGAQASGSNLEDEDRFLIANQMIGVFKTTVISASASFEPFHEAGWCNADIRYVHLEL